LYCGEGGREGGRKGREKGKGVNNCFYVVILEKE
jgi:hypothetical protein